MSRIRSMLILCLSIIGTDPSFSQASSAEEVAWQFLTRKLQLPDSLGTPGFDKINYRGNIWIFEKVHPQSFVLVRNSDPPHVIAYSLSNPFFPFDSVNSPLGMLLETLSSAPQTSKTDNLHKTTHDPAGPFLQTQWGQDWPFNFFCPEDEQGQNGHVYVGCAAVAMGQILRYYGKFNNFLFQAEFESPAYGLLISSLGNYDWVRMENIPIAMDLETSRLLYGLGVLTHMSYGPTASTTSNYMVYEGFKQLKYFDAQRMVRSATAPAVWIENFHQNIADSKPIYVSGSGHSFVCDGIDSEGMFHFNLGWYGYADGYYSPDLVLGFFISEAIFNVSPYSILFAPVDLVCETDGDVCQFSWSDDPLAPESPIGYRVYLNDTLFFPTRSRSISSESFPPGNHAIKVSAVYQMGESPWIGPIRMTIRGSTVEFEDPVLEGIIINEYNRRFSATESGLTTDQVQLLSSVTVDRPVISLGGLESCRNLQVVDLQGSGQEVDLGPVRHLQRLKSLTVKGLIASNIEWVANNVRLNELRVDSSSISSLSWVLALKDLFSLYIKATDLSGIETDLDFELLENLTLSGCKITQTDFIPSLANLRYLNLSDNQISRIRWNDKMNKLRYFDVSENQLSDLYFFEKIPDIRDFDVSHNQLPRFITGMFLDNLRSLNLSYNSIDTIHFTYPAADLEYLNLESNRIRNVSGLKNFGPNLAYVNLAENQLTDLWTGCLQHLEFLDISDNRIVHLNKIPNHPLLLHLDCRGNRISDLYPMVDHDYFRQLDHLDLSSNPISKESLEMFIPRMNGQVDTLMVPGSAEPLSPGYPFPARNQTVTEPEILLSWQISGVPDPVHYEVRIGDSPDDLAAAEGILDHAGYLLETDPGRNYYWTVKTISRDTSFISGIFCFRTFTPVSLPLLENFESYELFSYLPEVTEGWILPYQDSTVTMDGRIVSIRKYEGYQSMSINTVTGLQLPLKHQTQEVLKIRMQVLFETGRIGCLKLTDINGSDLELYFKSNGKCDLLFNQDYLYEFDYPRSQWFPLTITGHGGNNMIYMKIGSQQYLLPWYFPLGIVCIGELSFSGSPGPYYPWDGFPQFYLDNLEVLASGAVSVQTETVTQNLPVFPNPADTYTDFILPLPGIVSEPVLFDSSGRRIRTICSRPAADRIRIHTGSLTPGIYFITFPGDPGLKAVRLLIMHSIGIFDP